MGTLIEDVFATFLLNVKDYHILGLDMEVREYQLMDYLESAVSEINTIIGDAEDYLSIDKNNQCFMSDISRKQKDIIVSGMLCRWFMPYVLDAENLANNINLKDLPQYSPANLLDKLNDTQTRLQERFASDINKYSFKMADIEGLKL